MRFSFDNLFIDMEVYFILWVIGRIIEIFLEFSDRSSYIFSDFY